MDPLFEIEMERPILRIAVRLVDPLPLHRHEHPRVIVALHGGTVKILEESGTLREISATRNLTLTSAFALNSNS
jgi:hypothetical protein